MSSTLSWFLIAWAVVTGMLVVLLMYRSLIAMKEDDQIFLDPAESKLEAEQRELRARLSRITPYTKGLGFVSGGLLIVSAGVWFYEALARF
jgi:hypothetical protein